MTDSTFKLPDFVRPLTSSFAQPYDSCFIPRGFLFPETREGLATDAREFPLMDPFYARAKKTLSNRSYDDILKDTTDDSGVGFMDSTILHISEFDELLLDVQDNIQAFV